MKKKMTQPQVRKDNGKGSVVVVPRRPKDDASASSSSSSSDDEDDIKLTVVERPGSRPVETAQSKKVAAPEAPQSRQPKLQLPLEDDDDDDDDDESESSRDVKPIKVNTKFATDYHKRKEREDALRSTAVFGDDENTDESSDDEVAEELTDDIDHKINETIELIRSKDPRIYQPQFRPFGENADILEEETSGKQSKKKTAKTYKDMVRERALAGNLGEDDEEEKHEDEAAPPQTYSEELEAAKRAFKRALVTDEPDGTEDDGLELKAKARTTPLPPVPPKLKIKPQDADEEFLWKYINDRTWLKESGNAPGPSVPREDAELEEDEEELEKMEEFEHRFNFRFEEPGATEIVSHARQIEGSLRRKDDSTRARQRQAKLDRKELERQEKLAELRRLKEARRKMIEEQLTKSFAQAGRGARIPFKPEDLDKDFDPEEWDRKMAEAFNEDYYAEEDDELKVASGEEDSGKGDRDEVDEEVDEEDDDEQADAQAELIRTIAHEKAETEFEDEDFVGEGKFRYRQVAANDFGLTDEEILLADNNELNGFVSLKRMAPYAEKEWFASSKHRSRFRRALRKRLEGTTTQPAEQLRNKKPRVEEKPSSKASGELVGQMSSARLKSYGR